MDMRKYNEILVTTTSTIEGVKVQKFLKPISSHLVAGTNIFNDFFADVTDVFGGRSSTYQKQLITLYNEAIEKLKTNAINIGANGIIGLTVDFDEISGKGKSMFMITALGTAVILENKNIITLEQGSKNIDIQQLNNLKRKKEIIVQSENGDLELDKNNWDFIIENQLEEVFPQLISRLKVVADYPHGNSYEEFKSQFINYIVAFPDYKSKALLYQTLKTSMDHILYEKLIEIIGEINLLDFSQCIDLLNSEDSVLQKRALNLLLKDKEMYNEFDYKAIQEIIHLIEKVFQKKGVISSKKMLLSSREKEIWTCDCNKSNDIGDYCSSCGNDLFGFKERETKPFYVTLVLKNKLSLLAELLD
jgi:uncharacterized protein YbjQ (UPF0145 family)